MNDGIELRGQYVLLPLSQFPSDVTGAAVAHCEVCDQVQIQGNGGSKLI